MSQGSLEILFRKISPCDQFYLHNEHGFLENETVKSVKSLELNVLLLSIVMSLKKISWEK